MILFLTLLLALTLVQPVAPEDWCYESQAKKISCTEPSKWSGNCQDKQQSPINIDTKSVLRNDSLKPFQFVNYDKKEARDIKNNGHSVQVDLSGSIKISQGGLPGTYKAAAFHLHWSNSVNQGSEHTIDGKSYAMEMHIVHIKDKYSSVSEALNGDENNEIAVLGFLIKASSEKHPGFSNLVENLKNIPYKSKFASLKEFSLSDLLPKVDKLKHYYRYQGSLTTPDCQEKVIWTVFQEPIQLHEDQILEFSKQLFYNKENEEKMPIIDNFRKTQALGNRQVYTSGVGMALSHAWPTLLAPLLTYFLATSLH
ncbi:carbonic anhydrase 4 [Sarcophilus harrisii]|uniref:Carbonic anhydrase n=1 Tax=Sarcophilus harrisii TaxID=9305 RepID=A0A7N4NSE2_SARHA|nr:carbonic anhydrase 4 [Sarcophilus harrisii]